ncbi:MAG TPA: aminoglycoside phosphotransferase family protein [Thermomicrobiales bacterium]|nr:aminoglycoside phosphotransferase family protein [Thermomicrobiales bacterium]
MSASTRPPILLPNGVTLTAEDQRKLSWPGDHSASWLDSLPETITQWCDRWRVTLDPRMPEINYNLVLFGTSEIHGPVVIKMAPPHPEGAAEMEAVHIAQQPGVVRLYESDPSVSIMLQERVIPGTMLREHVERGEYTDDEATRIAASCMKRFWTPAPHSPHLITLRHWFRDLYGYRERFPDGGGPIPKEFIDLALSHADYLLATEGERVTVHGDLNPGNILRRQDDWVIIDPKGLIGERGYEVGQWMLNPYGLHLWPNLVEALDTRLTILSEMLELDRYRLWQWSVAHAVLSECWTVQEEAVDAEGLHAIEIVRALQQLPEAQRTIPSES